MFGFFKKKKEEKVSPSSIEGKKPVSKISQKPSGKPSKTHKQVEKGETTSKAKEQPTQAFESQGDDTATPSQKALRQHIRNAQSGVPVSQEEIISAPFLATKSKMMRGDIKIAEMTEDDYESNNLTKKDINIKAWKEYQRRFKIEPYDFKRKNVDNALIVVKKDINLLSKKYAMHIIFKGAKYNPNTQKVKLAFTDTKDLYNYIINNVKVEEIRTPIINLLMAIEVFNIIKQEKRLKLPEKLEKYYRERYNQKVLTLNLHKIHMKTKEEVLASFTNFDNKEGEVGDITTEYQEQVSSLHKQDIEDQADLNESPLAKKMNGMSKKIFNQRDIEDNIPNNEIDISKGVFEAIQKKQEEPQIPQQTQKFQQEEKSKNGLQKRYEEESNKKENDKHIFLSVIQKQKDDREGEPVNTEDDFKDFENALDKLAVANKEEIDHLKDEVKPDDKVDQSIEINDNNSQSKENKKEKKMEMMDFDEEYIQKVTGSAEPTIEAEQEQKDNSETVYTPIADNVLPFVDDREKEERENKAQQVEKINEEDYEVLEDITKDPIADMGGLDIPVYTNKNDAKPNLKDNLTNLKSLLAKKQQEKND